MEANIAIIGSGNIGSSIASGLLDSGLVGAGQLTLTRRKQEKLQAFRDRGVKTGDDNRAAVRESDIVILAVEPRQTDAVLESIAPDLQADRHILISIVTGVSIERIKNLTGSALRVVRAMPNTAIALRESMTCLATLEENDDAIRVAETIFSALGNCVVIREDQMNPATALVACGVAFFLRSIRAAAQGGIEIGFHSHDAIQMAAQTAKGAAELLLKGKKHPEEEIDRVTTPKGVTIAGLNQMEHEGFSSAMIRGITLAAEKASKVY